MELTCPKCQGPMRTYERNGVHVDQCTECRGIFLDRGELEHLVDAEARWNAGHAGSPGEQARPGAAPQHSPGYGAGSPGHTGAYGQQAGGQHSAQAGGLGGVVGEVLRQAGQSRSSSSHSSGYPAKRKKSFLDELFG